MSSCVWVFYFYSSDLHVSLRAHTMLILLLKFYNIPLNLEYQSLQYYSFLIHIALSIQDLFWFHKNFRIVFLSL